MHPRTLHVYWAEHDHHRPAVSQAGLYLSDTVQRRGQQYRTAGQQNLSLLAKRLLLYGLQQHRWRLTGGLSDLAHHPGGKPYLAQLPVRFSLSHSGQVAVCVLSADSPVGIDVQQWLPIRPGSEGLFLTPAERLTITPDDRLAMWCGKEAAYKAVGYELGAGLSSFRFTAPGRVVCPPVSLTLTPLTIRPGYLCYLALPINDDDRAVRITLDRVPYPY
jgi:4'-phosphopantetheinyl transferase